ncbi:odorant receptor 30a-like [Cimex lectularius]|uniref:Odorant receptor n=1 Tax=Cimex lectularius TaxID=79782 RepID=A0A8I6TFM2_CIMLE|nr:odorant receptor 30a-like [Cimex lectularius]
MERVTMLDPTKNPIKGFKMILTVSSIQIYDKKYALVIPIAWLICSFISLIFFIITIMKIKTADDIFAFVHHFVVYLSFINSVIWSYYKRDNWDRLIDGTHITFEYRSEIMYKKVAEMTKPRKEWLQKILNLSIFFLIFNILNIWLYSFIEKIQGNKPHLILFPVFPPFDMDYLPWQLVVLLWQQQVISAMLFTVYGVLGALTIFYDYISNEISLLKFAMLHIEERAKEMMKTTKMKYQNLTEQELYKKCLIACTNQCAKHHSIIYDYYLNAIQAVRYTYFIVVIVGIVALVCGGATIIFGSMNIKTKFFGMIIATLIFLYLAFWFGNEVRDLSDTIPWIVYDINWLELPKECHSTLRIMMTRSMKPMALTTSLGQNVDLENFMGLVKAAYSYFNMIYQGSQQGMF